jgi:hypothetical protein
MQQQFRQDPALEANWGVVKDWSEVSRYELVPQREARRKATATLRAVEGRQGILSCIQQYW